MVKKAIPDVYLGGSGLDTLEVPEYDTEWSDYANAFQVGTIGLASGVTRVGEFAARQLDAPDTAEDLKRYSKFWEGLSDEQRAQYSPGAKQSLAKEFATTDEQAAWRDLSSVMLQATESAPATIATMTPIGAAVRAGVTSKAALSAIGALSEGLIGAGYIAGDISREIEGLSTEQLNKIPGVADLRELDWSDESIKDALKKQQQTVAVPTGAAITAVTGAIAGPLEAKIFAGSSKLLPRVARGVAVEAPQEAVQEFSENAAVNYALGRDLTEGGLESALAGAFVGGPAGGGFAALTGGKTRQAATAEEAYKQALESGDEAGIKFAQDIVNKAMTPADAVDFFSKVESEVQKEQDKAKRAVVDEEQEAALKAHEEKDAEVVSKATEEQPAAPQPTEADLDQQLAEAADTEAAAYAPTAEETRQAAIDKEFEAPAVEPIPDSAKVQPTPKGAVEHFDAAINASAADVSEDATIGAPILTKQGKPSTRKKRFPKERGQALSGLVDDVLVAVDAMKKEGLDTAPIEKVISNFTKGSMTGDSVRSQFTGSRGGFYESVYKPQTKEFTDKVGEKKKLVVKLGGNKAIDQFLEDIQTAKSEVVSGAAKPKAKPKAKAVPKKRAAAKKISKGKKPINPNYVSDAEREARQAEIMTALESGQMDRDEGFDKFKARMKAEGKGVDGKKIKSVPKKQAAAKKISIAKSGADLTAKSTAANIWKLAQGETVANVANMRKNLGISEKVAPERIKELLNTAIDQVLNKKVDVDSLSADEKKVVKKLVNFINTKKGVSLVKQVKDLPQPAGKPVKGPAGQKKKFEHIFGEATSVIKKVAADISDVEFKELQKLFSKAVEDPEVDQEVFSKLVGFGVDIDSVNATLDALQNKRLELLQTAETAGEEKVVKLERSVVVANAVNETNGKLDSDQLNTFVDMIIAKPEADRFTFQDSFIKALVSDYGVSQDTANNLHRVINDTVGTRGVVREKSITETMAEASADKALPESYTTFYNKIKDTIKGWNLTEELFVESKEVFKARWETGILLSEMVEALNANNTSVPIALVNSIVIDSLHVDDHLRAVINKVNKLGYGDVPLLGKDIKHSGEFLQGVTSDGIVERAITLSTGLANTIQADGNVPSSMFMVETFTHELVHAATNNAIESDPVIRKKVQGMLDATRAEFVRQGKDIEGTYGLESIHEFIAEAFSNADFVADLNRIQSTGSPGVSVWVELLDMLKKVLGLNAKQGTVLHEVMAMHDELFQERSEADKLARQIKLNAKPRVEKKVAKQAQKAAKELHDILDKGEYVLDKEFYGPEGTVEQKMAELSRLLDQGENSLDISNMHSPKDVKYKQLMNRSLDQFTARAGGVLTDMMSNEGKTKYEEMGTLMSAAGDKVREFGLGTMMLDAIDTTYGKLFNNLMPDDIDLTNKSEYPDTKNPLKVLIRAWQNRQAMAKQFEAANDKLLKDVEQLERGDDTAKDMETMYEVATSATMYEVHPDLPWTDSSNSGYHAGKSGGAAAEIAHTAARKQFVALHSDVEAMYKRMGNFYQDTQQLARTKLLKSITHKYGLDTTKNMPDGIMIGDARTHKQIDELDLSTSLNEKDEIAVKQLLKSVNSRTLPNGPYFPLMRYGDYVVEGRKRSKKVFKRSDYKSATAMGKAIKATKDRYKAENQGAAVKNIKTDPATGDVSFDFFEYIFSTAETKIEAEALATEMHGQGFGFYDDSGKQTKSAVRIKGDKDFMDLEFAGQILAIAERKLKGGTQDKEAARVALREAMVTLLPDTAAQKRLLKRKGVRGASKDMGRGLANYMRAAGNSLASLEYISDISDVTHVVNNADRMVNDDSAIKMKQVAVELQRRAANNNTPGRITEWGSKLGFFNYLFSISYSVVNSTQPLLIALPWLSGKHGTRKSGAALANAYKMVGGEIAQAAWSTGFGAKAFTKEGVDANQVVTDLIEKISADGEQGIADMLGELQAEDIIGATFTLEIAEAAKGRGRHGTASAGFQKVMEMGRTMPHIVEIMNRTTTAIAAYNLAKADGMSTKDAREHARSAVRKTQFDYSELNRPRYFVKNDLLRAMTMFKIHPLGIYGLLIGNVKQLMSKDSTKAEGREAGKTLAMLLATHAAFAGAAGSLLMEPIKIAMGLLAMAFDDDDEMKEWLGEPEVAMRQFLFEATGSKAASEAAVYGLPRLMGVDMHTRLGLQSLMYMHSQEGDTPFERTVNGLIHSITGPVLGMEGGFTRAASAIASGQGWGKAMEYAMPKGIRDIQRAIRYKDEGMTDFNGNLIQGSESFTAKDLAVRAIGFSPSIEAETYLGRGYKQRHTSRLSRKVKALTNRWKDLPRAERSAFWDSEVREFNDALSDEDRRQFRITRGALQRSLKARRRHERETVKGVHFKKKERKLKEGLEFLNI